MTHVKYMNSTSTLFDFINANKCVFYNKIYTFAVPNAGVAKLVDALDLGSSASRLGGSSPSARTEF